MFYEVIPSGKIGVLTYNFDENLPAGTIVLIPLGKKTVPGIILKKVIQPNFKTKPIKQILYSTPLPAHLLKTLQFISDYYLIPIGSVISLVLPNGIEKKRRKKSPEISEKTEQLPPKLEENPEIKLNNAQKIALEGLKTAENATRLLFGITGSGKTNIYLKMAQNALERGKSVILLVPEIALTGQLVRVFQSFFGRRVVTIHSKQTEASRHLIFNSLLSEKDPKIIIGPRSALFAPLKNLGLIIIDEEHESTYYQENSPKYSAIRVASFIAKTLKIPLILGSATPNIEDYYFADKFNSLIKLTEKAKSTAKKPNIQIIDFKDRTKFSKNKYFSAPLLTSIKNNLENHQQTLIFHNRRGSAPLTICENCGEEILCPHCFLPLTLHTDSFVLSCHTCGFSEKVPQGCPKCGSPSLIHKGFGTKLLESELRKLFKTAQIKRFDADNKPTESLDSLYDEVKNGTIDILIGTQTVAKGLDLPHLATVGIVQADAGLSLPDFAAYERTFELLTQVIGRVGRGHLETAEVLIQTYRPDHPVLNFAVNENYLDFYTYELNRRKTSFFPPFCFLMKLEITMKTEATVLKKVRTLQQKLIKNPNFLVSPPMPAFHEHTDKGYTWQIIVRSRSRKELLKIAENLDKNFKITLDPPRLL